MEKKKSLWRPILLGLFLVTMLILSKVFGLGDKLGELRIWIESLGSLGPIVFVAIYAVATVAAIPGSALTLAAGALFGSVLGVVCVSIAATLGASLCFLIARYFARGSITGWLGSNEKFKRLDKLTEEQGAIIVAITRLVPLFPFNLLNYGFGLTGVKFLTYVGWSWLCMLPGTVLYVVGGDALVSGLESGEIPWSLIGVIAVVVVFLLLLANIARKKLKSE